MSKFEEKTIRLTKEKWFKFQHHYLKSKSLSIIDLEKTVLWILHTLWALFICYLFPWQGTAFDIMILSTVFSALSVFYYFISDLIARSIIKLISLDEWHNKKYKKLGKELSNKEGLLAVEDMMLNGELSACFLDDYVRNFIYVIEQGISNQQNLAITLKQKTLDREAVDKKYEKMAHEIADIQSQIESINKKITLS